MRVDAFGVKGLQRQLSDRLLPLTGRRSGPERHRALAATIEWSYGLLSEREAQVLRAVSAFAGSFTTEGAAAVAEVSGDDATEALTQLTTKSLLSIDINEDNVAYRLLETTRAFCIDHLRQDASHNAVLQRHAQYVYQLLNRATRAWAQRPDKKLAENYDRALSDLYGAILSSTKISQALVFQAMEAMRRAVEIAASIGDIESQLRSLRILGVYELFVGEPRSALATLKKFSTVVALHSPDSLAESESYLGTAELLLGRLEEARARLERLWEPGLRQIRDSSQATRAPSHVMTMFEYVLTHPRWLTGVPDAAVQLALTTITHTSEFENTLFQNTALSYACPVLYWSGLYDECRRYAAMLETHCEKYGFFQRRPIGAIYQAAVACLESDSGSEGIRVMQRSIEDLRAANHLARMPYHLGLLAEALARQMKHEEAETIIDAALDSVRVQGEAWCLPEVLRIRALVLSGRQDDDGAEGTLLVAIQKAKDIGALSWELRAANDLATLWMRQARAQEAREMLEPIFGRFTEGYATRDLVHAAKLLRELSPP
ncbi:MAG TPA: hypothetical protein VIU34_05230 [Steroidobacter sp.]